VLDAGTALKTVNHDEYSCTLCAAGYKPFTVNPRVRRIAGHDPTSFVYQPLQVCLGLLGEPSRKSRCKPTYGGSYQTRETRDN